ncbi:hypothetical protein PHYPSEUDO_015429 [Phytophthora pseudosyringae]|uniref:At2g23090-like zinc-binding domain-containing protein n=1 Tax=Phytophthora pseudosyringae TaxID=221518 RepID=A0A8T1VZI3_9STRA|nr:hypothetical protein PHYPSEUDO_015429 [Phytophthora pseudosyringae]
MGGGNGQKSAAKRDRNNAKKMKDTKQKNHAESKAKMEADKVGIKCKICMTTFLITASKSQLNDHYESKHSSKGFTIEQCFPGKV